MKPRVYDPVGQVEMVAYVGGPHVRSTSAHTLVSLNRVDDVTLEVTQIPVLVIQLEDTLLFSVERAPLVHCDDCLDWPAPCAAVIWASGPFSVDPLQRRRAFVLVIDV